MCENLRFKYFVLFVQSYAASIHPSGEFRFSVTDHHYLSALPHPPSSPPLHNLAMARDHTKSLLPYRTILTDAEKEYRDTPLSDRDGVIERLLEQIKQAAEGEGAEIADDETVCKVCALLLTSGIEIN
jgi:hypothetical protein